LRIKALIARLATPVVGSIARHFPRTRRWLWHRVIGPYFAWRDYNFTVTTHFGCHLKGTTSDVIQRCIYYFGRWEPNVEAFLQSRLRTGDVFIDVGANVGYFTLLGAKLVGRQGRVVAIEPSSSVFEQLSANVARNQFEGGVRCIHAAASDSKSVVTLYAGQTGNIGSASIIREEGGALERVRSAPLPDLLRPEEIECLRVIKIDVEGAESLVLKGIQPILNRLRSDAEIVIEVTPGLYATDEIVATLAKDGWRPYALLPQDSIENYFAPAKQTYAVRISGPILRRTDVLFSRIEADVITYD